VHGLALNFVWLESLVGSRSVLSILFVAGVATSFGLRCACSGRSGGLVVQLSQRGMDLALSTQQGQTALHRAAFEGHANVCMLLSRLGASLEDRDMKVPCGYAEFALDS